MDGAPAPALEAALARARDLVRAELDRALASEPGPVAAAMLYACEGGKGLRGLLVLEGARLY
uniref:hypothetical protein n=1 Tax=Staphylococcus aureus TaxID=1280 RepID=UPI00301C258D